MGEKESQGSILLNIALVVCGIILCILGYAFVTGSILPQSSPIASPEEVAPSGMEGFERIIQVDVRNGVGQGGLARRTTRYLRDHGFDVVEAGNHSHFTVEQSQVIDRGGDREAALHLARTLGISEEHVHEELRPEAYLDASVIIGHDYEALDPFKNQSPDSP